MTTQLEEDHLLLCNAIISCFVVLHKTGSRKVWTYYYVPATRSDLIRSDYYYYSVEEWIVIINNKSQPQTTVRLLSQSVNLLVKYMS